MPAVEPPPYLRSPFLMGLWCSDYISDDAVEATRRGKDLCEVFQGILKWAFLPKDSGYLCPERRLFIDRQKSPSNKYDGHGRLEVYNDCWQPLAIDATPVILLTSLKPGIDSLFVSTAIEFKKMHPDWSLTIRVVLPYNDKDDYLKCGIFDTRAKIDEFNRLYIAIVHDSTILEEAVIPVPLDNDWCEKCSPFGIDQDLLIKIKAERKLPESPRGLGVGCDSGRLVNTSQPSRNLGTIGCVI